MLDGETTVVDGIHVRLKGVAAPEVAHFEKLGERGGQAAKSFVIELVEGKAVVCDLTQERTHGRPAAVAQQCPIEDRGKDLPEATD